MSYYPYGYGYGDGQYQGQPTAANHPHPGSFGNTVPPPHGSVPGLHAAPAKHTFDQNRSTIPGLAFSQPAEAVRWPQWQSTEGPNLVPASQYYRRQNGTPNEISGPSGPEPSNKGNQGGPTSQATVQQPETRPADDDTAEEGELTEGEFNDFYEPESLNEAPTTGHEEDDDYEPGELAWDGGEVQAQLEAEAEAQAQRRREAGKAAPPSNTAARERSGSYSPYLSPAEIQPAVAPAAHPALQVDSPQPQAPANTASTAEPDRTQEEQLAEAKKRAADAILRLWPLNVKYMNYIEEGIDETVVRELFKELGLSIHPQPTAPAITGPQIPGLAPPAPSKSSVAAGSPVKKPAQENRTKAPAHPIQPDQPAAQQPSRRIDASAGAPQAAAPAESTAAPRSAPSSVQSPVKLPVSAAPTAADKAEERKDRIARLLAAKGAKTPGASASPAFGATQQGTTQAPKAAAESGPAASPPQVSSALTEKQLQQQHKREALEKSRLARAAQRAASLKTNTKAPAPATSQETATTEVSKQPGPTEQPEPKEPEPTKEPEPGMPRSNEQSTEQSSEKPPGSLPTSGATEPATTMPPKTAQDHAPGPISTSTAQPSVSTWKEAPGIPGLFTSTSTSTSTSTPASAALSTAAPPVTGNQRKRPVAADFVDDGPHHPFKRPFSDGRRQRLVINVSDDSDDSDDSDVEMDIASGDESVPTQATDTPLRRTTSFRHVPPLPDFVGQRQVSSPSTNGVDGATSTPPVNLEHMNKEIEAMKRRIALAEARKKLMQARSTSNNQTPATSKSGGQTPEAIPDTSVSKPSPQPAPSSSPSPNASDVPTGRSSPVPAQSDMVSAKLPKPSRRPKAGQVQPGDQSTRAQRVRTLSQSIPNIEGKLQTKMHKLRLLQSQAARLEKEIENDVAEKQRLAQELDSLQREEEDEAETGTRAETPRPTANGAGVSSPVPARSEEEEGPAGDKNDVPLSAVDADASAASRTAVSEPSTQGRIPTVMGQAQSTEDVATEETVAATSEATATVDETEETALASEKGKVEEEPEAPAPATTAEPSDHGPQPDSVSEPHAPVETIPGDDNEPEDVSMQMENEPEDASMQSESPERDEDVEGELRQLDDADGPSAAAPDDAPDTQDATGGIDNTATTMTATEQDVVSLTGRDSEVQSPDVNVDGSVVPEQISVGLDDSNPDPGVGSTREERPNVPDGRRKSTSSGGLTPYESPLRWFRDFRYHPGFDREVAGGLRSLTYSNNIEVNTPVCPDQLRGGPCPRGDDCQYQHFESMKLPDDQILLQLGSTTLEGPRKSQFNNGLRELLQDMRSRNIKDFPTIARGIAEYRNRFLGDPSKVLSLGDVAL